MPRKKTSKKTPKEDPQVVAERYKRKKDAIQKRLDNLKLREERELAEIQLDNNGEYKKVQKDIQKARKALQMARIGRARKQDSIKAHERAIEQRKKQIVMHNEQEADRERKLKELEQQAENMRKTAVTEVQKAVSRSPLDAPGFGYPST